MTRKVVAVAACLAAGGLVPWGCVWPDKNDSGILQRYRQAVTTRSPQPRAGSEGLESLTPTGPTITPPLRLVKDPNTGRRQLRLSLDEAILRALANSLDIRVESFDPAIAREEVVRAAAAFDTIVFGAWELQKQDEQSQSIAVLASQTRTWSYQAGIKQKTVTGANWSLAYTLTGTRQTDLTFSRFRKYYEPTAALEVTQPLLRDGWPEANLAEVNLAKVNQKVSDEAFRQKVEEIVTQVIGTYWALVQARVDLAIQQNLLDETIRTLERVRARFELDATAVQIKQAEAAVESRRASLIAAAKIIQDAQDALARLIADPQLNLLTDCDILPATDPLAAPIKVDVADRLITALKHNPTLAQARLAVEAADINVALAVNQTLPRLDLTAGATFQGLDSTAHQANENLNSGDYASYAVGLTAEYPLGNRAAIAELRRQRFSRRKSLTDLQNSADQVAQELRERVRRVETNYQEMLAQRAAVAATQAQLRALEDTEQIRERLTPEFLQLKLQAQEAVSQAQRAELAALIVYNTALADLDRVTGTVLQVQRVRIALPVATDLGTAPPGRVATQSAATASAGPVTVLDAYRQALSGGQSQARQGQVSRPQ